MSTADDVMALRRKLEALAAGFDAGVIHRYRLRLPPACRVSLYRRLRAAAGSVLRRAGLRRKLQHEPWLPGLRHAGDTAGTSAFLIWATGMARDDLRRACATFQALQSGIPDKVPVLVTDVADFAFYARLGWLVEYLPNLAEPAQRFAGQKVCYLAWRYRDAPAVPASIGLRPNLQIQDLHID